MNGFTVWQKIKYSLVFIITIPTLFGLVLMGFDWVWDFEIQNWEWIRLLMYSVFLMVICLMVCIATRDSEKVDKQGGE